MTKLQWFLVPFGVAMISQGYYRLSCACRLCTVADVAAGWLVGAVVMSLVVLIRLVRRRSLESSE